MHTCDCLTEPTFYLLCGRTKHTYTRDWLLTYQNQCVDVPAGLDDSDVQRGDDGAGAGL